MAGAGFKDFTVGEVLTSSDVDQYLMQQAVMRFASSAARGSALGTAVGAGTALAEGMMSYLDDLNVVEVYTGSGWRAPGAGIGSNVVQTVKTDSFTTTSTSFTTVTGLTVTIAPSSATSKILVLGQITYSAESGNSFGHFKITRGGTDIYRGDAGSSRVRAVWGGYSTANNEQELRTGSVVYLDSPATTSATTYQFEARRGLSGTVSVNLSNGAGSDANHANGASSITVIEVAA